MCEGAFDAFQRFPKLLDRLGTMPGSFSVCLNPDTVPFKLYAPRSIPMGWRNKAKTVLDKMFDLDLIEPIDVLSGVLDSP